MFTISTGGYAEDPKVAALPDGGFIVTWDGLFANHRAGGRRQRLGHCRPPFRSPMATRPATRSWSTPATRTPTSTIRASPPNSPAAGRFIAWSDEHSFTGTGEDADPDGVRGRVLELDQ